ncbi:MAG TPA: HEAT repeat domain-containing protein [Planctomycetota bacterium]|nr:HEAT repeat domain-containing protein [Planctomycetota bacterium]HRR80223.1 HEAT repeat domain-containing protein [Planctomycetota bacterium]HRT93129.1 HEAT repeat domain-containing protein [Planctomycetota bacterium]
MTDWRRTTQFSLWLGALPAACLMGISAAFGGEWPSDDEAEGFVALVHRALPDFEIAETARNTIPRHWFTYEPVAFLVEAKRGTASASFWFLPRPWVGIMRYRAAFDEYWDCVLVGKGCRVIAEATFPKLGETLWKLDLTRPSLRGENWWSASQVYGPRTREADEIAQRLVAEHCPDIRQRAGATVSLWRLGVPAVSVFRKGLDDPWAGAREVSIWALGALGDRQAVPRLCTIVKDPAIRSDLRESAAGALRDIGDPHAAPALLEALQLPRQSQRSWILVDALGRFRHAPAAATLLEILRSSCDARCRAKAAQALAALRCQEAVPVLVKLLEENVDRSLRRSLLRLTATWGEPTKEARLLLEPPTDAVVGKPMPMVLYVENVSDGPLHFLPFLTGTLVVDGERKENRTLFSVWTGRATMGVNEAWEREYDLSRDVTQAGTHTVRWETRGAASNETRFTVKAP